MRKGGAFLLMEDMLVTNYIIIFIMESSLAGRAYLGFGYWTGEVRFLGGVGLLCIFGNPIIFNIK